MVGVQRIPRDWNELLELLNSIQAEYLVVGAYAMAAHGHERYTKDLDLWFAPTAGNARKLQTVLADFGFAELAPSVEEWTSHHAMVQMGVEPYRVDLLNFATGLDFAQAWKTSIVGDMGTVRVRCLDREALIRNKLATARLKDFADAEILAPERAREIRAALAKVLAQDSK